MKKVTLRLLAILLLFSYFTFGGSVKLGWCPSPSANVAGYYIAYGMGNNITNWTPSVYSHPSTNPCPGTLVLNGSNWFLNYTNRIDVGNVTSATITNLAAGVTYYFTVIAYSSFGDEAPPSNEVKYTVASVSSPSNLKAD